MIIKLFKISKDFFDLMYSPFIEDISENEVIREKQDEEKGWQGSSDDEEWEEYVCSCNLCHIADKLILFINPKIYKKLNYNKID
jgi:hypothetical protein